MKAVNELLTRGQAWMNMEHSAGCLISSRIRLARNIDGIAFPGWAGEEECLRLWRRLRPILRELRELGSCLVLDADKLDPVDKEVLVERRLISREIAGKGAGSGIVIRKDAAVSIMVNEEDHLRIQGIAPGLDLSGIWKQINILDSEIEKLVKYSVSPRLGYLTACPTNVGTGMRASVMLHLPGLSLMNEIKPVIKGISKMGMTVRGLWGEGTDSSGNMFQVSNQVTLGEDEETIVRRLEQLVLEIAGHEKNARLRMMQQKESLLRDCVGRARGILLNAELLDSSEALTLLSHLRLGIDMGVVKEWDKTTVDKLFLSIQPGHLQKEKGRPAVARERDLERSRLVRKRLSHRTIRQGEI